MCSPGYEPVSEAGFRNESENTCEGKKDTASSVSSSVVFGATHPTFPRHQRTAWCPKPQGFTPYTDCQFYSFGTFPLPPAPYFGKTKKGVELKIVLELTVHCISTQYSSSSSSLTVRIRASLTGTPTGLTMQGALSDPGAMMNPGTLCRNVRVERLEGGSYLIQAALPLASNPTWRRHLLAPQPGSLAAKPPVIFPDLPNNSVHGPVGNSNEWDPGGCCVRGGRVTWITPHTLKSKMNGRCSHLGQAEREGIIAPGWTLSQGGQPRPHDDPGDTGTEMKAKPHSARPTGLHP